MTLNLMANGFFKNPGPQWVQSGLHIMQTSTMYMAYLEEKALEKCPHQPYIYLRYLDDIVIIWHHGRTVFSEFIDIFNSHQPPIRFKATIHENFIDCLDTTIYEDPNYPNYILTKVYFSQLIFTSCLLKHRFTLGIRLVVY